MNILLLAIGAALVNNVILSQFLGLCPFLECPRVSTQQPEWEQRLCSS